MNHEVAIFRDNIILKATNSVLSRRDRVSCAEKSDANYFNSQRSKTVKTNNFIKNIT